MSYLVRKVELSVTNVAPFLPAVYSDWSILSKLLLSFVHLSNEIDEALSSFWHSLLRPVGELELADCSGLSILTGTDMDFQYGWTGLLFADSAIKIKFFKKKPSKSEVQVEVYVSASNFHLGCDLNKADIQDGRRNQQAAAQRHFFLPFVQNLPFCLKYNHFKWPPCLCCESIHLEAKTVSHMYIKEEVDVGLECGSRGSLQMTLRCIYSTLKLLHHREFQYCPPSGT